MAETTPGAGARRPASLLLSIALLLVAMVSFQASATFAKSLFPRVGAQGLAALRLTFSAVMLVVMAKPWRGVRLDRSLGSLIGYGLTLGAMNTLFYSALARIPLGVAVAIEFIGPLGVAVGASRRPRDFAWAALAVAGLALLAPWPGASRAIDPLGAGLALGAGGCWALYILLGRRAGENYGARATGLGMIIAAAVFLPLGVARAGPSLFAPSLLPAAILLAFLSSALPYSLEMVVLTRVPTRVFGVLMSLEPALGALAGLIVLGETLSLGQGVGIGCVVAAALGSSLTARTAASP